MLRTGGPKLAFGTALVAVLTLTSAVYADTPAATTNEVASEEAQAEARKHFDAGVALLDDPDGAKYEQAYHAFKKAYELTKSPTVLGNVAFCAFHLERDGEAIDAYTTYLREVQDISERERLQIQRDLATMTTTVARVRIVAKSPGKSFILTDRRVPARGNPIENAYTLEGEELTLRVRPGRHVFRLRAPDGQESTPLEATIDPGSSTTHELSFPPPARPLERDTSPAPPERPSASPSATGPIVLGALGLAAVGTGVVTGLLANGKTADIEQACPNDVCPASYDLAGERSSAKTLGTVADITLIGGGVLLGGALLWYVLLPSGGSKSTIGKTGAMCTPDGCGINFQRGF